RTEAPSGAAGCGCTRRRSPATNCESAFGRCCHLSVIVAMVSPENHSLPHFTFQGPVSSIIYIMRITHFGFLPVFARDGVAVHRKKSTTTIGVNDASFSR